MRNKLTESQIEDLRLAAAKMNGASRRAFQAEMCLKYCDGNARYAETILGWGRKNIQLGLEEKRSGIICLGAQSMCSGAKSWEEKHPIAAAALKEIAEAHAQQDPSFATSIAYTRLTASEAVAQLRSQGFDESQIPAPSTMLSWAKTMKWRGIPPIVNLSQKIYHKGISLTKKAMEEIELRLLRNPHLPKWDILIRPC
ncbi:MAG: hypothetical protein AB4038_21825 [Prochloraceae cyanobacterium]